jgi:hypothetical protein
MDTPETTATTHMLLLPSRRLSLKWQGGSREGCLAGLRLM